MSVAPVTLVGMAPISFSALASLLVCVALGGVAGALIMRSLLRERLRSAERRVNEHQARSAQELALHTQQARLDAEAEHRGTREELASALSRAEALERELQQVYRTQEQHRVEQAQQQQVLRTLAPMRDAMTKFEQSLTQMEQDRAAQHGQLTEQLREAARAEQLLRDSADTLATALRANTTRGQWGEMQLRRVVELAGLTAHIDFTEQTELRTRDGKVRPDLVITLPGEKTLAVDAKAPMDQLLKAEQLSRDGNDEAARAARSAHVRALRGHIDTLAKRDYPGALGTSPELVIAFVPSEAMLSQAFDDDPQLLEYAFAHRVVLAAPTTLLAVLTAVAHSWRQDALSADAQQLLAASRELHKRLGTAASHIERLGSSLTRSVEQYNRMVGSFERSVFPAARTIATLATGDALVTPEPVDATARALTAPEFLAGGGAPPNPETQAET